MEKEYRAILREIGYVIIWIVACLPIACGYVMDGGDVTIWLARIEEVKNGFLARKMYLFPTAELVVEHSAQFSALDSNLLLFVPALMQCLGISITTSYRVYMLMLNVVALFSLKRFFSAIFEDKNTVFAGVMLYVCSPYRVYLWYDKADLGFAAAWAILPWVLGEMYDFWKGKISHKRMLMVAIALALVGYADGIAMAITVGIIVLGTIWYRKWSGVYVVVLGGVVFWPGAIYWMRYLIKGGMEVWNLPLGSIASKGYDIGQFFSSYTYRADSPGMGMALIVALAMLWWSILQDEGMNINKKYGFFVLMMCMFSVMSMKLFPWDIVQRVGMPFLRVVGIMETPGIFFGFVSLAASVLGACGLEVVQQREEKFLRYCVPVIVSFAAIGVAIYICNILTYSRLPMFLK